MTRTDVFIIPEAPPKLRPAQSGVRGASLAGIRLGVLDNAKGNADHLLKLVVDGLRAMFPIASLTSLRKPNSAFAAEIGLLDQLAAKADLVVSAMAD